MIKIGVMVGKGGLEPPRIAAPDPKSGPSANSGTSPGCQTILIIKRIPAQQETRLPVRTIASYKTSLKLIVMRTAALVQFIKINIIMGCKACKTLLLF